jgi:hypothetical protein
VLKIYCALSAECAPDRSHSTKVPSAALHRVWSCQPQPLAAALGLSRSELERQRRLPHASGWGHTGCDTAHTSASTPPLRSRPATCAVVSTAPAARPTAPTQRHTLKASDSAISAKTSGGFISQVQVREGTTNKMLFRDLIDYLTDTCTGVSRGIAFWATFGLSHG